MSKRNRKKFTRRSVEEMRELLAATQEILDAEELQMTIRHLFYVLATRKLVKKTERDYNNLDKHLVRWRERGDIDYGAFSDSTRWYIRPASYAGIRDALQRTRDNYRRDMWASQPYYVEVWVEKDAIAGLVADTAMSFGVPTFVCRGFAARTGIFEASQTFNKVRENGKTSVIFHLGDHDPSGEVGARFIERTLLNKHDCEVDFRSIAVTSAQIEQFDLPTRPTKESSHSKHWTGGESVELDAMSTAQIQRIVEDAIVGLIEKDEWGKVKLIEKSERETITKIMSRFRRAGAG